MLDELKRVFCELLMSIYFYMSSYLLWLVMREKTRRKLDKVKELLKRGYTLRKAIKEVKIGWKTYYKYENYVLNDPSVPRPKRKFYVHVGPFLVDKGTDTVLRQVARDIAIKMIISKYKTVSIYRG